MSEQRVQMGTEWWTAAEIVEQLVFSLNVGFSQVDGAGTRALSEAEKLAFVHELRSLLSAKFPA